MPLTWLAHQVPALGMKFARPRWFEATALCVGSMTPDLMYAFSAYLGIDTHRFPAACVVGIPLATVLAVVLRRVVAPIGPACLPDTTWLRLRSFAVLARRRPPMLTTVIGVTLGIGSHIVLDWFTHPGRPGVRWLGYDDVDVTVFGVTEPLAGVFQLLGHSLGSFAGLGLLVVIGRRRLLEDWYGVDAVATARRWRPSRRQLGTFWILAMLGGVAGVFWGMGGERIELIQRAFAGVVLGVIVGASWIRRGESGVGRPPDSDRAQATATPVG